VRRALVAALALLAMAPATADASVSGAVAAVKRAEHRGGAWASQVQCRTIVRNRLYRCTFVHMDSYGDIYDDDATVRQYGRRYLV